MNTPELKPITLNGRQYNPLAFYGVTDLTGKMYEPNDPTWEDAETVQLLGTGEVITVNRSELDPHTAAWVNWQATN